VLKKTYNMNKVKLLFWITFLLIGARVRAQCSSQRMYECDKYTVCDYDMEFKYHTNCNTYMEEVMWVFNSDKTKVVLDFGKVRRVYKVLSTGCHESKPWFKLEETSESSPFSRPGDIVFIDIDSKKKWIILTGENSKGETYITTYRYTSSKD